VTKKTKYILLVDSREKKSVRAILHQLGVKYRTKALESHDYESNQCCFERKTIFDLIGSMRSGHLDDQLRRLQRYCEDNNKVGFLCVSGSLKDAEEVLKRRNLKLNEKSVLGALASSAVRYGVSLIWNCGGPATEEGFDINPDRELLYVIHSIAEKVSEGKLGLPQRKILPKRYENRRIAVLCDVLRVSPNIARRLLKRYGTLRNILLADTRHLTLIDGIGNATITRLRTLLDGKV